MLLVSIVEAQVMVDVDGYTTTDKVVCNRISCSTLRLPASQRSRYCVCSLSIVDKC